MEPITSCDTKLADLLEYLDTKGEHISGYLFSVKPAIPEEIKLDFNLVSGKVFVSANALSDYAVALAEADKKLAEEAGNVDTSEAGDNEPVSDEQQPAGSTDTEVVQPVPTEPLATEESEAPAVDAVSPVQSTEENV